jgi:chromosome segregation ATPase
MDCNFTTKETTLLEHEKELQHRTCAMEEKTQKLNQRENDLKLLQVDLENDKMKLEKTMADFEQEKLQLKEVEGAIFEAHELNKNVENVWAKLCYGAIESWRIHSVHGANHEAQGRPIMYKRTRTLTKKK